MIYCQRALQAKEIKKKNRGKTSWKSEKKTKKKEKKRKGQKDLSQAGNEVRGIVSSFGNEVTFKV